MKSKFILLTLLSGLCLSGCDALDRFFAETNNNNQQTNQTQSNTSSSGEGNNLNEEEINSTQTGEEENNNQTNTEENQNTEGENTNTEGENTTAEEGNGGNEGHNDPPPTPSNPGNEEEESDTRVTQAYFVDKTLDLQVNKIIYVTVSFVTSNNISSYDLTDEEKEGVFASSNPAVATVSEIGKITAVSVGEAIITYTTKLGNFVASMTVYSHNSLSDIKREYVRLDDPDDIKLGDELVFACPDFNLAASVNISGGYIVPAPVTFSSDGSKITEMSQYVAEYYVGPGKADDVFTFENQENCYLACRETEGGRKLSYSDNGKAQINWVVEKPVGYNETFIVSYDLAKDYWLMFNKISNSDFRFNIYASNEGSLMKKPIIYRKTIIRN